MKPLARDARDTFFLVGVVALCAAPHLLRVPPWAAGMVILLLAWRLLLAARSQPLPHRGWLVALLLVAGVGAKLTHGALIGRPAGLTLVTVLLALKLLEMHQRRDAYVVFFLGFFLVLAQFLHSQALWVAAWAGLSVWGLLSSVVLAQMPLGQPNLRVAAREAARTTLLGLPVMVLLFVLFPRIAPLWGVPSQGASTGLTDRLSFGQVADLATDERIALRLRPLDGRPLPAPAQIYIRGPVLTQFDGLTWQTLPTEGRAHATPALQFAPTPDAPALRYEMLLEPQRLEWLPELEFGAGTPGDLWTPDGVRLLRTADHSWRAERPVTERLRLVMEAWPGGRARSPLTPHPSLRAALSLPPGLNPQLRAWAQTLAPEGDARAKVAALLAHIRTEAFTYTLSPGPYGEVSPHAIDEFWFGRRWGFCEHYAAASVFALRAAGVPARIVTGYQGADPTLQDGWAVVRNSNAHAWIEFWQAGQGWLRADPTAAVAPDRVEWGQRLAPPRGILRGTLDALDPTLWLHLRHWGERIDLRWQQWVVGYARSQQFELLGRLGFEAPDWEALGQVTAAVIGVLTLGLLAWTRWQQRDANPWARLHRRAHRALQHAGLLQAATHHAPLRWALLARDQWGSAAASVAHQLQTLETQRFGAPTPLSAVDAWRWRWRWWRDFTGALAVLRHTAPPPPSAP
ncbi:transglutaminase family protein [Inhella gelatinilytica]|uniref:DUF3488 domain-containing transglutaminase family protein n=1 Tax=Inhella gelatinilytica TaxID=2795030 RepID=A0A931IZH5_9BURK|nr:DUF3488 and transglutaminase-like domain-containing protein [Inhella gelatinilytica]MBH9552818.1 DUF3488 domain-containing transglutaminase family protein [Inhella gelatinilytica]